MMLRPSRVHWKSPLLHAKPFISAPTRGTVSALRPSRASPSPAAEMNQTPISLLSPVLYRTEKEEQLSRAERPDRGLEGLQSDSGSAEGASMGGGSLPDSPRAEGDFMQQLQANRREADEENREKQSTGRRCRSLQDYMHFCGVVAGRSRSGD